MTLQEQYIKDFEVSLVDAQSRLKQDFLEIRGNKPSTELIQNIVLNIYDQRLTIRELGSLGVIPPRTIQITLWDKDAVLPVLKAIDSAHLGLTATNDGNIIRATLSALGDERRGELIKFVKKIVENARIQIRNKRDDVMKKIKDSESNKDLTKDDVFRAKEKIQKVMDKVNDEIDGLLNNKITEIGE